MGSAKYLTSGASGSAVHAATSRDRNRPAPLARSNLAIRGGGTKLSNRSGRNISTTTLLSTDRRIAALYFQRYCMAEARDLDLRRHQVDSMRQSRAIASKRPATARRGGKAPLRRRVEPDKTALTLRLQAELGAQRRRADPNGLLLGWPSNAPQSEATQEGRHVSTAAAAAAAAAAADGVLRPRTEGNSAAMAEARRL